MRRVYCILLLLLCLPLIALVAGCGSTSSGNFTLSAASATVMQGSSQTFRVTSTASPGFKNPITVTVSDLPSGVTVSPASVTVQPGIAATFKLQASTSAAVGPATVMLHGTSGSLAASTAVSVAITAEPTPDFSLNLATSTLTILQGAFTTVDLSATSGSGFAGPIQVTTTGAPFGIVVTPSSPSLVPGSPDSLTVAVASTVPAGTYPLLLTGTSGPVAHSLTLTVIVNPMQMDADFAITATPNTMAVAQGADSNLVQIGITGSNGFNGNVAFTVSGLPSGVISVPASGMLQQAQTQPILFRAAADAAIGAASVTITGTSGSLTHTATIALNVTAQTAPDVLGMSVSPSSQTVVAGSIGVFSVSVSGPPGFNGPVAVTLAGLPPGVIAMPSSFSLTVGTPQTVVVAAGATAQPGASTLTFTGRFSSVSGSSDLGLSVVAPTAPGFDVVTWHEDNGRTGLNASETTLTPANVVSSSFGKLANYAADGSVDAQPLFVSGLTIGSQSHNVLYMASEKGTVYAYDADTGALQWKVSTVGGNETPSDNRGCSDISPSIGITATPVIDRYYQPNGAIFLVALTKDSSGAYHQRLHALDLITGAELAGSPVEIAATSMTGGVTNVFDPSKYVERAALLRSNGSIYLTWAPPCDQQATFDYGSWLMAYNEGTLQLQSAVNLTPNGSGGAIGMSGSGPAADPIGNLFLVSGKGTFDTQTNGFLQPGLGDYGNAYVQLSTQNALLTILDYFEPVNGVSGSPNYQDQGSGGILIVPDIDRGQGNMLLLAIGAGKDGNIYQVDRTFMGEFWDGQFDYNYNTLTNALPNGAASMPAYFNQIFYYGGIGDHLKSFNVLDKTGAVVSQSTATFGDPGATPVISANGTNSAVLWALETTVGQGPVLHAYDATNLSTELYNSTQAQTSGVPRDAIGPASKFSVPVVANGHVYVGTQSGVAVFGLLP